MTAKLTPLQAGLIDLLATWGPLTELAIAWAWRHNGEEISARMRRYRGERHPEGTPDYPYPPWPPARNWKGKTFGEWATHPSEQTRQQMVKAGLLVRVRVPGAYSDGWRKRRSPAVVWGLSAAGADIAAQRSDALSARRNDWYAAAQEAGRAHDRRHWATWLDQGQVTDDPSPWPGIRWIGRPSQVPAEHKKVAWAHSYRREADYRETSSCCYARPVPESEAVAWLREQGEGLAASVGTK